VDSNSSILNGPFKVWKLGPDNPKTQFQFILPSDPGDRTDFSTGYFGRIWQARRYIVENNVIELAVHKLPADPSSLRAVGIFVYGGDFFIEHSSVTTKGRIFPDVLLRRNIVRHVDNLIDTSQKPLGIEVYSADNAIIEKNSILVDRPTPIECTDCGAVATF